MSARAGPVHPVPFAAPLCLFGPVCSSLPFHFFSSLPSLPFLLCRFHCPGHPLGLGGPSASTGWRLPGASRGHRLHRCHLGLKAHSRCQSPGSSRVWPSELPLGPLGLWSTSLASWHGRLRSAFGVLDDVHLVRDIFECYHPLMALFQSLKICGLWWGQPGCCRRARV